MAKKDNTSVPKAYLGENGRFRPGMDARLKSDLVQAALGLDNPNALHKFSKAAAEKLLEERGWTSFLDRKREILAAKEAAASEKAKTKAVQTAAKKQAASKPKAEEAEGSMAEQVAAEEAQHAAETKAATAAKSSGVEVTPDPKPSKRTRSTSRKR